MNSLAQTGQPATAAHSQRRRGVGWSAIASGVALVIVSEAPYFPSSFGLVLLGATVVLFLGMIPIAMWIHSGVVTRETGAGAALSRAAETIGIVGMTISVIVAILVLPRWIPTVQGQILTTSALGVIGLWLLAANILVLRLRLFNRVLAALGALAGLGMLLSAVVMWVELGAGNLGGAVSTLENIRMLGVYLGEALYIIWALWLGIWLLVRKR
ncbi:MAG TPA: hypothetical protein VFS83_01290 [Ktedonobacterales bacterium]|nr:hypothetical protein [Ktedonobacterales bacterium]